MDLSKLVNDDEDKDRSPELPKTAQQLASARGSGHYPPPPSHVGLPQGQTPQYHPPPPPAGPSRSSSQGLTPLQMPPQVSPGGQHPFQQPYAQSPAAGPPYRPLENYSATTPGSRPGSHGQQYSQSALNHQHPGMPTSAHAHTSSLSPTPPSHHSITPHSLRHSPLSAMSHAPHPQQHPQYSFQHSQPSTPLGPPPPHFSRSATHPDLGSPYHQRTHSGASNGVPAGSPSHQYQRGPSVESPNAVYGRPSPQLRRTSDYLSQVERERSMSVSPKTKVAPRPQSLGSRHSSQQDVYGSNRSSVPTNSAGSLAGSPGHVTQPYNISGPPPQPFVHPSNSASEVSQPAQSSSQGAPPPYPQPGITENSHAVSQYPTYQPGPAPPPLLHHQSQHKMGMSNLLTPTSEVPPAINGNFIPAGMTPRENTGLQQSPNVFAKPSPMSKEAAASQAQADGPHDQQQMQVDSAHEPASQSTRYPPSSLKRSATEVSGQQPPLKQRKTMTRKYSQRPPWAQLSKHNPRFQQQGPVPNGGLSRQTPQHQTPAPQSNGQAMTNGNVLDGREPWNYHPPLDMDLIEASAILGKWEKTFRWNTPFPAMLRAVYDWLWQNLEQLGDVGMDAKEGTVEIEGKIGWLIDNNTDERLKLPVMTMCVMQPDQGHRYSFRSEMKLVSPIHMLIAIYHKTNSSQDEHKHLNEYLNAAIQTSLKPGRIPMTYKHLYETDTFHHLSPTALSLLPPSLQTRTPARRENRLRITTDTRTHAITARIIKHKLADLHIYNPGAYDSRISINLEINLNRPDISPASLIAADDAARGNEVPRVKDRLSYQHLAYSIDLTKVEMAGLPPRFELEQEVDSALLRRQMGLAKRGEPNAFGDVVSGFLDNLVFLMREKAP